MHGESISTLPAHAAKPKRFKKSRHKPVTTRREKKIDVHKIALGVSHKQILDRLWGAIDWAKYYNSDGSLKRGKRLPRDFWSRHPELNPPVPRMPN